MGKSWENDGTCRKIWTELNGVWMGKSPMKWRIVHCNVWLLDGMDYFCMWKSHGFPLWTMIYKWWLFYIYVKVYPTSRVTFRWPTQLTDDFSEGATVKHGNRPSPCCWLNRPAVVTSNPCGGFPCPKSLGVPWIPLIPSCVFCVYMLCHFFQEWFFLLFFSIFFIFC